METTTIEKNEVYYLKLMNKKMTSVKNNVQFFAWITILNLIAGIVLAIMYLG